MAGFTLKERGKGHTRHFTIDLALNVSFLNKKRVLDMLDNIPEYSIVDINGFNSVYIDNDILEIIQEYKVKTHNKHIQLVLKDIPQVEIIGLH